MIETIKQLIPAPLSLLAYRGSISHGLFIDDKNSEWASDDIDLLGVYFNTPEEYLSLKIPDIKCEHMIDQYDVVFYEFKNFVKMLSKANPNVFTLLWYTEDCLLTKDFYGRALIDLRDIFVSKKIYYTFKSYADNCLKLVSKEFVYAGYMGAKRKALAKKVGYDSKNAAHCIRLLKMLNEFLLTHEFKVKRTEDRQELLDIKTGKWKINDVKSYVELLVNDLTLNFNKSDLPESPDFDAINKLLTDIMYDYLMTSRRNC